MNTVDMSFVLICASMALLMTPALAVFYASLCRKKSEVDIMMQVWICLAVVRPLSANGLRRHHPCLDLRRDSGTDDPESLGFICAALEPRGLHPIGPYDLGRRTVRLTWLGCFAAK